MHRAASDCLGGRATMETKDATRRREPASIAFPAIRLSCLFPSGKAGRSKKTLELNIEERNLFVVHLACGSQSAQIIYTSTSLTFPELEANQLATCLPNPLALPRRHKCPLAMLCCQPSNHRNRWSSRKHRYSENPLSSQ